MSIIRTRATFPGGTMKFFMLGVVEVRYLEAKGCERMLSGKLL